ncbi:hypothetical protein AK830_g1204 [Neonectria ditissima]|uniref:CFEM domain-containing protein n=1 Tax=Neonectria ditissima TaxID=78410 RepID=A0A0P7BJI1_9HYPO|nr:hypothetical protein AK830_g1204 [Neonectria ditissima]
MANANAKNLIDSIPECVSGCFENGVAATGCDEDDYDCYCYAKNHQTIVDTMSVCLDNKERKLDETCTDDEMFQMENRYWMVCKEYWEPTGTATEPASATMTEVKTASTKTTSISSRITSTTFTTSASTAFSSSSQEPTSVDPESAESTNTISNSKDKDTGLSTGAQAGIGVGVGLAVILLGVAVFLWMRERKKRRQLEEKLVEANAASAVQGMAYAKEKGDIFEMEGDRPYVEELRGDMRTPELNGISHVSPVNGASSSPDSISTVSTPSSPRSPSPPGLSPPDRNNRVLSAELDSKGRPSPPRVSSEESDALTPDPLRRGSR